MICYNSVRKNEKEWCGIKRPNYSFSRGMYIIEAALEYFISMMLTDAYLAKVASAVGLSTRVTGILTAFVSLGCGFQIFALFLRNRTPVKAWVTVLHIVNQTFFALVWLTPLFPLSATAKGLLFTGFLLLGHVIHNMINPAKVNWFMSLVDENKRGIFTANKEIVSLISGMIYSLLMGFALDYLPENVSLIVVGVTLFGLMVLHTVTLILSDEKPVPREKSVSLKGFFSDKKSTKIMLLVIAVNVLWAIAHYVSTPFYGTYKNDELGFSMTFVAVLSILYAVVRASVSRFFGKYADKRSFVGMLTLCFIFAAAAFFVNTFTVPSNGAVMFTVYYLLYAISMAGINSCAINLIYDYVEPEKRTVALAFSQSISGIVGFVTTYLAGFLVEKIQKDGLHLFGFDLYAQQVVSFISFILVLVVLLYTNLVVRKLPRK